ncbi:hypothetical protein Efla_000521 [Eimeria flavescens]
MVPLSPAAASAPPSTSAVANARKSPGSSSPQQHPSLNHARTFRLPSHPATTQHTRAWAAMDGILCEVIIDTGSLSQLGSLSQAGEPIKALVGSRRRHSLPSRNSDPRPSHVCALAHDTTVAPNARAWIQALLSPPPSSLTDSATTPSLEPSQVYWASVATHDGVSLVDEFRDCLNDGTEKLPATNLLRARLDTGDTAPASLPPRRLLPATRGVVCNAVAEWDAQGITEPGTGCWSTPIVMSTAIHELTITATFARSSLPCDTQRSAFLVGGPLIFAHVVSREIVRVCPSKVKAILDLPAPTIPKSVPRQYWHLPILPYVQIQFFSHSSPLFKADPSKRDFEWTDECAAAWRSLCASRSEHSEPALAHPDYCKPFFVRCDGSGRPPSHHTASVPSSFGSMMRAPSASWPAPPVPSWITGKNGPPGKWKQHLSGH